MHTWIVSERKTRWRVLMALAAPLLALTEVIEAQIGEAERRSAEAPHFEIASIKAVAGESIIQCGDLACMNLPPQIVDSQRFRAMTVLNGPIGLIEWACGVKSLQVIGAPEWPSRQKFEVQATTELPSNGDRIRSNQTRFHPDWSRNPRADSGPRPQT
jgi:hypothetical protein